MITYGFYNSDNHDRRYTAMQLSSIFDGIIRDGIYMSIGTCFKVLPGEGMMVIVGIGRGWFNHSWILNDSIYPIIIPQSEILLDRIDAIVIDINQVRESRKNDIILVKGIPSQNPVRPNLINEKDHYQYPLAYIYVGSGITNISAANITSMVGTSETPYVTGILDTVSVDDLYNQWKAEFDSFFLNTKNKADEMGEEAKRKWLDWYRAYINENQLMIVNFEKELRDWASLLDDFINEDSETYILNEITKIKERLNSFDDMKKELIYDHSISDYIFGNDMEDIIRDENGTPIEGVSLIIEEKYKKEETNISLPSDQILIQRDDRMLLLPRGKFLDLVVSDYTFDFLDSLCVTAPSLRKNIYRGKNLGSSVTYDQWISIGNGSFKGLFLGDYWNIKGTMWQIVDFDYWYGTGDVSCFTHHVVIMPMMDEGEPMMDISGNTNNGYINTTLVQHTLPSKIETVKGAFGNHLLTHKGVFPASASNGLYRDIGWYSITLEIPNELMIFGTYTYSKDRSSDDSISLRRTTDTRQLALFYLKPSYIPRNAWLRDICNEEYYCSVDQYGTPGITKANDYSGFYPVFGIKK